MAVVPRRAVDQQSPDPMQPDMSERDRRPLIALRSSLGRRTVVGIAVAHPSIRDIVSIRVNGPLERNAKALSCLCNVRDRPDPSLHLGGPQTRRVAARRPRRLRRRSRCRAHLPGPCHGSHRNLVLGASRSKSLSAKATATRAHSRRRRRRSGRNTRHGREPSRAALVESADGEAHPPALASRLGSPAVGRPVGPSSWEGTKMTEKICPECN